MTSYAERLRALHAAGRINLHERVLGDGRHHVWLTAFWTIRVDRYHRDFEFCCRFVWGELTLRAPWLQFADV